MRVALIALLTTGVVVAQEKKPPEKETPSGLGRVACAVPEERPGFRTFKALDLPPPEKPGFASHELLPGFEYVAPEETPAGQPGDRDAATAQAKAWLTDALGAELAAGFVHQETRATEPEDKDPKAPRPPGQWDVVFAQQVDGIPVNTSTVVWIDKGVVRRASVQVVGVKDLTAPGKPVIAATDAIARVDRRLVTKRRPFRVTRVRLLWTFDQRIEEEDETITPHSLCWKVELEDAETKRRGVILVHADTGEVWEDD